MKLEIAKNGEEVNIGQGGVIQASIDVTSLPFLYKLATKNQYSDPIGSIVRELVSNAYDATTEANSDKPVIVKFVNNSPLWEIQFIDHGVGMSPERIALYMQWYNSSKRDDNVQIGGFGIGGKSPLAYVSFYFIDTVSNGTLYKYIVSEGETIPECLLLSEETTDLPNGTTVHFEIANSQELLKFKAAISRQLCYFDNVWIEDLTSYGSTNFDNEGTVYDTDLFKYAFNNKSSELRKLHVLIDKVPYPINFDIIKEDSIDIPFGLKFDIGELEVTPSRENLMYTDEVIDKIKSKIKILRNFVYEKYSKQHRNIADLFSYIKLKNETLDSFVLGYKPFDITTLIPEKKRLKYVYSPYPDYQHVHEFIEFFEVRKLSKSKVSANPTYFSKDRVSSYIYYSNGELNNYSNIFIREGWLCKKDSHAKLKTILQNKVRKNRLARGRGDVSFYERLSQGTKSEVGWAYKHWKSAKIFKEYLISLMRTYPHPTEDWIEDYKAEMKEKRKSSSTPKGSVLGYISSGNRYTFQLEEMAKKTVVFYVIDRPSAGYDIMELLKDYDIDTKAKGKFVEKFMFISVSETQYKSLKLLKNLVHIDDVYKVKVLKKMFAKLYYFAKVRSNLIQDTYKMVLIKRSSDYYYSLYTNLNKTISQYHNSIYAFALRHEKHVKPNKRWSACYSYLLKQVKEFNSFYRLNDFISHVDSTLPDKYLLKLIKGKHLNKYKNVKEERRIETETVSESDKWDEESDRWDEENILIDREPENNGEESTVERKIISTESIGKSDNISETSRAELDLLN